MGQNEEAWGRVGRQQLGVGGAGPSSTCHRIPPATSSACCAHPTAVPIQHGPSHRSVNSLLHAHPLNCSDISCSGLGMAHSATVSLLSPEVWPPALDTRVTSAAMSVWGGYGQAGGGQQGGVRWFSVG